MTVSFSLKKNPQDLFLFSTLHHEYYLTNYSLSPAKHNYKHIGEQREDYSLDKSTKIKRKWRFLIDNSWSESLEEWTSVTV